MLTSFSSSANKHCDSDAQCDGVGNIVAGITMSGLGVAMIWNFIFSVFESSEEKNEHQKFNLWLKEQK